MFAYVFFDNIPISTFAYRRDIVSITKTSYIGYVDHLRPGGDPSKAYVPVVSEVIEQLTDPDGNYLLVPEIEVNTYWTNLPYEAREVIGLYYSKSLASHCR